MRLPRLFLTTGVVVLLATATGCSHPTSPSTPLTLTRFRGDSAGFLAFSGYDTAQTIVIHDRDTWVRTWSDINRRTTPLPALPDVDFTSEMVVVAALGTRPSSGYDVVFTSASEAGEIVTVEVESRAPGAGCVTLTVITSPVDLARIPRRNGAITFRTTPKVTTCGAVP